MGGRTVGGFWAALPFWMSLGLVPMVILAARLGGFWVLLPVVYAWWATTLLDVLTGQDSTNPDTETPDAALFWHRLITLIWFPVQAAVLFGALWWATHIATLSALELIGFFAGIGVLSGTIGIIYAHELMHQSSRLERWLADLLLATVLYSHFRTEHLLVHHQYVGTPRDAVTARYNEGFHRFFARVLPQSFHSALRAEASRQRKLGRSPWHRSNPFWRYAVLQVCAVALAVAIGGWLGLALFLWQAIVAIWQLELTNYIEHYGLTRKMLDNGRYEPVQARHSWNAEHRATNWLMINLQRHSDHHKRPDRRYPLLQTFPQAEAPKLPMGYPAMGVLAMIPPLWRRRMNPRVREWRRLHYPEIKDWGPYNRGEGLVDG